MAAHELLPSGSMDVNGLVEEIMTIRKETTTSEKAKDITFDKILETSNEEWKELAENEEIKEKINMAAVKKMEENLKHTVLVDFETGSDLEKIASEQISKLKKSVGDALEKEKTMKAEGPEKYNEYRKSLFREVEKIVEATKVEHAKEMPSKGESISRGKAGTSEIEEIIEEEKKGKKSEGAENPAESENDDHHNVKHGRHQQGHGALKTGIQKSGQFLTKSAEYLADLTGKHLHKAATLSAEKLKKLGEMGEEAIEKYELKKRASISRIFRKYGIPVIFSIFRTLHCILFGIQIHFPLI